MKNENDHTIRMLIMHEAATTSQVENKAKNAGQALTSKAPCRGSPLEQGRGVP